MKKEVNSSDCLIAYLDMLGYRDRVMTTDEANFLFAPIDSALKRWRDYIEKSELGKSGVFRTCVSVEVLSDAFVIVFDRQRFLGGDEERDPLRVIILNVFLTLISYLLQDCIRGTGLLFRGAVVRGQYYQRQFENLDGGNFIFSRGLIKAYEMAENIADVPRIIVDSSAFEGIDVDTLCLKKHRPDSSLLRDEDGLYSLNIYASVATDYYLAPTILRNVVDILNNKVREHKENLHVLRKYAWFANYHNKIVNCLMAEDGWQRYYMELKEKKESLLIVLPQSL
ncbi:MAG: hypothetical protein HQL24_04095 [Candidatus Omnitrophica bacterium]|nr:hypothetical protein [Candidatus Omnitrophota bacterium]